MNSDFLENQSEWYKASSDAGGYAIISMKGGDSYGWELHNNIYDNSFAFSNNHKKITPAAQSFDVIL